MAFRVISKRKAKRQAAPEASDILDLDLDGGEETSQTPSSTTTGQTSTTVPATSVSIPAQQTSTPSYMKPQKKNVVATQPWVFRMMKSIWNWTRHFGTQSLAVAGPINSALLTTGEVQTDDLYTRRILLLDPDGRPCEIYIDKTGHIVCNYEYQNVYVYPKDVQTRKFLYRNPDDIVMNFVNLTPAETLVNFVQFQSPAYKELNGQTCYKLCPADSEDKNVDHTLLFTCAQTKKIVGLEVLDKDGEFIKPIDIHAPSGMTVRKLTINLPCFRYNVQDGQSEDEMDLRYVQLPLTNPWDRADGGQDLPFLPPFLSPPAPVICPMMPMPPPVPPPFPPDMEEDIFDDNPLDQDIFEDVDASQTKKIVIGGVPYHKNYYTPTYVNVNLKRSEFEANVQQYLKVKLEDA